MLLPEVSYVRSDDVHIAYQVIGDGPVDVLLVLADLTHLEHEWREPGLARWLGRIADWSRLIRFDKRGFGLSDRRIEAATIEDRVADIGSVLDAVESERAVLVGISEGAQMAMQYAATHPERVSSLVVYGSGARNTAAPDYDLQMAADDIEPFLRHIIEHWGDPSQDIPLMLLAPSRMDDPQFRAWLAELQRLGSSPGQYLEVVLSGFDIDVRDVLASIQVPTLILHRTDDAMCPIANGRYLASHIPDAQLIELDGADHVPWVGDSDAIADAIETHATGARSQRRRTDRNVPPVLRDHHVTRREYEVLELIASGAVNPTIADQLHLSVRTVESHISSLLTKLDAESRAGLIAAGLATRA